ncbi:MAG: ParA family protein [Candidatus Kapabacteria bacterium]|jgi:chromosome partitioning protein|nr:ParA family protein [Candidatus Kapabacteria bacterium]
MKIITFANHKGGVGKTTTVANIGYALAHHYKKKVLMIDMDPQTNLTAHFGIYERPERTMYEVLKGSATITETILRLSSNLYLAPSSLDVTNSDAELQSVTGREFLLSEALDKVYGYDVILIDTPPSLGVLTVNAFTASTDICIVVQTEFFALQGLAKLYEIIGIVQKRTNPKLVISGVIATMFDKRKGMHCEALQALETQFPKELFATHITEAIALVEAASAGKSIFEYKPSSKVAEQYDEIAKAMVNRVLA